MSNVLVVEDDKDLNQAYQQILEHFGHQVKTAFDGKQALEVLKGNPDFEPDIVLLDLLMPIMGGLEFLRKFKKTSSTDSKVLIFTNMENSPELAEAYKLGAERCVIKSWTAPQNLNLIVNEALR
jgi:CheY-like chemotaxis protein